MPLGRRVLHFLAGLLILGIIISLMAASTAFRNFVIVVLLIIGSGIWLLVESANKVTEQRKKAQQAQEHYAVTAIKETELVLSDVKLVPASYGMGDLVLSGNAVNDSNSPLATIFFQVTLTDCREAVCRIVGQKDTSAASPVQASALFQLIRVKV